LDSSGAPRIDVAGVVSELLRPRIESSEAGKVIRSEYVAHLGIYREERAASRSVRSYALVEGRLVPCTLRIDGVLRIETDEADYHSREFVAAVPTLLVDGLSLGLDRLTWSRRYRRRGGEEIEYDFCFMHLALPALLLAPALFGCRLVERYERANGPDVWYGYPEDWGAALETMLRNTEIDLAEILSTTGPSYETCRGSLSELLEIRSDPAKLWSRIPQSLREAWTQYILSSIHVHSVERLSRLLLGKARRVCVKRATHALSNWSEEELDLLSDPVALAIFIKAYCAASRLVDAVIDIVDDMY